MAKRVFLRELPLFGMILGVVYACSDTASISTKPNPNFSSGGDGGSGGSSASAGTGGSGNAINVGKGGKGGKGGSGAQGGTSGSSASGGSAADGEGGFGDVPSFGGFPDVTFDYEPDMGGQGGACATESGQATLVKRPMDVIVVIDNSKSMQGEIQAVQARINGDFAAIIGNSGIDYRVIMVSRYGNVYRENYDSGDASDSAFSICIGSPLSSLTCPTASGSTVPAPANNPPRFYHHSTDIGSNNLWCRLLDSYHISDPISQNGRAGWTPIAPNGWKDFVRADAYKVFIAITDDSPTTNATNGCPGLTNDLAGAQAFDTALRTLDGAQFGAVDGQRNYKWYSIVGMHADAANAILTPDQPVETRCCTAGGTAQTVCQGTTGQTLTNSSNPGEGYQELSRMTEGLRYPSCYNANFDGIFNAIAQGVIEGAKASCEYDVPQPSHGIVDVNQTKVAYKPGSGANVPLTRRASEAACAAGEGFYYSSDNSQIHLCPATCAVVQADPQAKVSIDFGCLGS